MNEKLGTDDHFRQLAENIHEVFWMLDARGERVLYVSPGYEEVCGRTPQSLYDGTTPWIENVHPDDRSLMNQNVEQRKSGIFADLELRIIKPDGTLRWVRNRPFPIKDETGNVARIAGLMEDITERKELEEELRLAKERVELAVRGSNLSIWDFNMTDGNLENSRMTLVNVWESLGHDPLTAPTDFANGFSRTIHPEDHIRIGKAVQEFFDSGKREFEVEYRAGTKDGSYRWTLARGLLLRDPTGMPIRFIGSCADITDLQRAKDERERLTTQLRLLLESTDQGIHGIDQEGRCTFINRANAEKLGYSPEEILGCDMHELIHHSYKDGSHYPKSECPIYRVLRDGPGCRMNEEVLWRKDGTSFPAEYSSFPIIHDGVRQGAVVTITDITGRKLAEQELRQAKKIAEAANRAKDEFLANVSHEIRTPMNAILGMTELTLDTSLTEDQRTCLQTVKSASEDLLSIINDLLDFSKIEAGKMELDPSEFSLRAAVNDTLHTLAVRAHRKGLELVSIVKPDVPDALVGDAPRLRQVLINLVGNAIKFTEAGEVLVQVEIAAGLAAEGQTNISFIVRDTGIGIASDKQESIFRAFEQEDTSTTRKYGGTGLGLTISANLATLMGGRITVDSKPGRGSTFTFTAVFTGNPLPTELPATYPPFLLRDLRVLVVDDNATNRRILDEWLHDWQMASVSVGDGLAALDALWGAAASGQPYSLVLLDARMPDTDGMALAMKIRNRAELAHTRIIMLTSSDRAEEVAGFRGLRIDAHLLKPVDQNQLLETIYRVMSRGQNGEQVETRPDRMKDADSVPAAETRSLNVLVAEDDEFSAQVLARLLVRRGHDVQLARDGREATVLAAEGRFDLLISDIHLPELDGFDVIKVIREREQSTGQHLAAIALTARSRKEDRERCLEAGMDAFLTKPIRAAELWAAIDKVLPEPPLSERSQPDLLDARVLLAACGDDRTNLKELCEEFRLRLPERLSVVEAAFAQRDSSRLREATHRLYGMIAVFSSSAAAVASDLEEYAEREQLDEAQPLVERLRTSCAELIALAKTISLETLRRDSR